MSNGEQFSTPKGYTCPIYSTCLTQQSPYNGTINFDNIFNSLELVFVVMSLNTFSDIMYYIVDAEHLVAALFFVVGIIILAYGLASLFISIVASTFKVIREEIDVDYDSDAMIDNLIKHRNDHIKFICRTSIGTIYYYLREIPLIIIILDMIVQCSVTIHTKQSTLFRMYMWEIFVASFLAVDIAIRFVIYMPDVKYFFTSRFNVVDLFLAVANVIIVLPLVKNNEQIYKWLTVFQIVRFYRVVLAVPFIQNLWARVLGQARVIFDVTLFYIMFVYLASILGCLLLQGVVPTIDQGGNSEFTFQTLGNSFLAMYVVSSTENWTGIMYNAIQFTDSVFARACVGTFFSVWLIMSNFVTINMFIAVLSENLDLSITGKRMEQFFLFFKQELRHQTDSNIQQTREGIKFFLRFLTPRSRRTDDDKAIFEKVVEMLKNSNFNNFLNEDQDQQNDQVSFFFFFCLILWN